MNIYLDDQLQITDMPIGTISDGIPLSKLGSILKIIDNNQHQQTKIALGPWTLPTEQDSDKVILLTDGPPSGDYLSIIPIVMSQNPPPSAINASLRLIHALPNTRPLTLQIRPVRTHLVNNGLGTLQPQQIGEQDLPWITVGEASTAGFASAYVGRVPEIYDVRVLFSGSNTASGELANVQLLAGNVYDFLAVQGSDASKAKLVILQPGIQIGGRGANSDNATAVFESVNATLTALAPKVTLTPTRIDTVTPTKTPVPTNTPRPSNTPSVVEPDVIVDPAPPDAAFGQISLSGQNFAASKDFKVTIDEGTTVVFSGTIGGDGALVSVVIKLPDTLPPGPHTLKVCVDCNARGVQQVVYPVFIIAAPNVTPTPTATP